MTTHDESPITRTSSKRMAKGILIMVITLAFGAAIIVPFWQTMIHNPPIASTLKHEEAPPIPSGTQTSIGTIEGVTKQQQKSSANANATTGNQASTAAPAQAPAQEPTAAGPAGTPLTILQGSSVQGSPDFDPDTLTVKKGDKITVTNKDTLPHTVTSGTGPTDPNSAKQFDTSIIEPAATADIETTNITAGDYPFHCAIHPYMTGKLVVQ
ncbi:MAG: cupredoxin domain-containing protein [Nitrososphaeraceae archaeon]|jgi:plastocyanin|nr:cupredoxin domain-containing protein [Nitrososphaeraceae archaeon]MDW0216812.1 cupredoxin domain-containing protein [Nitrososphaeraceae archaeon]MDW0225714.1 cupredoxin domain-containing protein [Nitrososphaeraceae archaeon]MDW0233905.1 cupredoxin domain-containing protein [Nitrososphaeraceae archaeon]MDW0246890.1 cupredoxin domain-containing protein [Nitrososphaeraceae archaeon]